MAIQTTPLTYTEGDTILRGQLARDTSTTVPAPGVLVVHTWAGCGQFEQRKAVELARLGYGALAADMYGDGIIGSGPDENASLMAPLMKDRRLLQRRVRSGLNALQSVDGVDPNRTAAIGFCFGGLCVLDLARSGAEFQGAISVHGLLDPPGNPATGTIVPKVLVLHGWDDPMATPTALAGLATELTEARADWQIHAYGHTMHAFTNPAANDPAKGTVYDAKADRRAWRAMNDFLSEAIGPATGSRSGRQPLTA